MWPRNGHPETEKQGPVSGHNSGMAFARIVVENFLADTEAREVRQWLTDEPLSGRIVALVLIKAPIFA